MFLSVGALADFPVSGEAVMSVVTFWSQNPKAFCLSGLYLLIFTTVRIDAEKLLQDIVK